MKTFEKNAVEKMSALDLAKIVERFFGWLRLEVGDGAEVFGLPITLGAFEIARNLSRAELLAVCGEIAVHLEKVAENELELA